MLHMLRNLILMSFLCLQNNFILSRSLVKIFNVNGQNFTCGSSEYFLGRQYFRAECKLFTLAYFGILLHTLLYSGILFYTLAYSGILWHTLAYIGILWHTLAYSGPC